MIFLVLLFNINLSHSKQIHIESISKEGRNIGEQGADLDQILSFGAVWTDGKIYGDEQNMSVF
jgi:hypothetical protein